MLRLEKNLGIMMRHLGFLVIFCCGFVWANEPLLPIQAKNEPLTAKQSLGKALFHEKGLSGDGTVSCASCHDLKTGGVDRLKTSTGIKGQKGPINAPTVYNSTYNFVQFWDGRATSLKEQAAGPVTNPLEMGATWPQVIQFIKNNPKYTKQFNALYQGKINQDTITDAIADFESTLVTPSAFDAYLQGDNDAISEKAKLGYRLFKSYGCVACHNGQNVGGNMYMKMGLVKDYFKQRGGELTAADLGRFNVTQKGADKHLFKVPSLRNVALTSPYFHDGSVSNLNDAVVIMAQVQLNRNLPKEDVIAIVEFLQSLTGTSLKPEAKD